MEKACPIVLCSLNARYVHTNLALRYLQAHTRACWPDAPDIGLAELTLGDQTLADVRRLYRLNARVYAFSCYIWNIGPTRLICRELKKVRPDAWIIWGGPEVSFDAARLLADEPAVDLIIRGEGETAFLDLLQALFRGRGDTGRPANGEQPDFAGIPGLTWRDPDGGPARSNPSGPLLGGADWTFPYTAESLAGLENRIVYYESSRGCPFGCTYCLSSLDRMVRHRPLPQVFAELDRLIEADLRQVKLVDRTFNCNPGRALQIWQYLLDRRAKIGRTNFHFEVAGDLLDDQAADLLNQAPPGLFQLEIGVQTINPDVLAAINRSMDIDQLQNQVRRLRQKDSVHLHLDLIAGLPGEDPGQFSRSLDWVWDLQPQQLQLGFLKVLPGTRMQRQAGELGFLWQSGPPYEVLQSDRMSFGDLAELKSVEQVMDLYHNSGIFCQALPWLVGRWPRPWLFFRDLAAWAGENGYLSRSLGLEERFRLLDRFVREKRPDLADGRPLAGAWRDLLRQDYIVSGQKDQPDWLRFWESTAKPAVRARLLDYRQDCLRRFPGSRRLRAERIGFDWQRWQSGGELAPAGWLLCYSLDGSRPAVLDNCPADDLYCSDS